MQIKLDKIFTILSEKNPNPKIELNYASDFELLVAIILSAQTTDISVNKVTTKLYLKANTPEQILNFGLENLLQYLSSLNLYKTKGKHILETSKILIEKYKGNIPRDFDLLLKLPGVGRKTANVFLNSFYGEFRVGVDTHIARVSKRLGVTYDDNPIKTEKTLVDVIPEQWRKYSHHWLVLHGRYVCKARKPLCDICEIKNYCNYYTLVKI